MLQVSKSFLGKKTKQQTLVAGTLRTITVECTNISKKKKKRKKKKNPKKKKRGGGEGGGGGGGGNGRVEVGEKSSPRVPH